tara:strand:- start:303 stop:485 length:183 start_codon:yes stop_codon:yes gene_type:complete
MFGCCKKKNNDNDDEDVNIYTGLDEKQEKLMVEDLKEVDADPEYTDIEENVYNVIEEITE